MQRRARADSWGAESMARGGKRVGAGRKPHVPPLKERYVRLTDEQCALLRKWGRGDLSAGLRWLIEQAKHLVGKPEPGPPHSSE